MKALWWFRKRQADNDATFVSDELGEWIRVSNPRVSWLLRIVDKAFRKARLDPLKTYSLYFKTDEEFGGLTELKALIATPFVRKFKDVHEVLSSSLEKSFIREFRSIRDGGMVYWFVDVVAASNGTHKDPFYNLFYPLNVHGERIPYQVHELFQALISALGKCNVSRLCRVGDELIINARCAKFEESNVPVFVKVLSYFVDPHYVNLHKPTHEELQVRVKNVRKERIYPIVWDGLSKVPSTC